MKISLLISIEISIVATFKIVDNSFASKDARVETLKISLLCGSLVVSRFVQTIDYFVQSEGLHAPNLPLHFSDILLRKAIDQVSPFQQTAAMFLTANAVDERIIVHV